MDRRDIFEKTFKEKDFVVPKIEIRKTKLLTASLTENTKLPLVTFQLKEKDKLLKEIRRPMAYLRKKYESRPEKYQMPGYVPSTPEDGILSSRSVISYLPYHDEGHKIHIVRLKGKKEVFLEELSVTPLSEIIRRNVPMESYHRGYKFNEKSQCHIAPGPE